MAKLAFMTIAVLIAEVDDPRIQGFLDRVENNNKNAENSEGFIGRAITDPETGESNWGKRTMPKVYQRDEYLNKRVMTLSLWDDLESVFAFSYYGSHGESLQHRYEWFVKSDLPIYVAYWVADGERPTWEQACERLDRLAAEGPTPEAFNFKNAFDGRGNPIRVDRKRAKVKAAQYDMMYSS